MDIQQIRCGRHQRQWRERCRVIGQIGEQQTIGDKTKAGEQQRVAIRLGVGCVRCADDSATAGAIFHQHCAFPVFCQARGHDPCDDIGFAAGCIRHDNRHGPRRIRLRDSCARNDKQRCSKQCAGNTGHLRQHLIGLSGGGSAGQQCIPRLLNSQRRRCDGSYSCLMPANFTARAQLGQSLRTNLSKSSTDVGRGSEP